MSPISTVWPPPPVNRPSRLQSSFFGSHGSGGFGLAKLAVDDGTRGRVTSLLVQLTDTALANANRPTATPGLIAASTGGWIGLRFGGGSLASLAREVKEIVFKFSNSEVLNTNHNAVLNTNHNGTVRRERTTVTVGVSVA